MQSSRTPAVRTVVLDLDGTLVDSVPVHVLAWQAAFRDVGLQIPSHRIRSAIGVGGDRIVEMLAGHAAEESLGDELRERHPQQLDLLFDRIVPTEGAVQLLTTLKDHGFHLTLASSGERDLTDRLLELLPETSSLIDNVLTGSDAERSKPDGELIVRALGGTDPDHAVLIGDAVWDVRAAADAGIGCIGLLTGGASRDELTQAGAIDVHETPQTLAEHVATEGRLPGF
ncbi:MAG: HAD family hydrolase [Nocardioides sp.]